MIKVIPLVICLIFSTLYVTFKRHLNQLKDRNVIWIIKIYHACFKNQFGNHPLCFVLTTPSRLLLPLAIFLSGFELLNMSL